MELDFLGIVDDLHIGIAVYRAVDDGQNFEFVYANNEVGRLENVALQEIIGKRVTDAFPGVTELGLFEVFQKVYKTGESQRHPISMYKDTRIAGWRENFVFKLDNGLIVAAYTDETRQKQLEEELLGSQSEKEAILEGAADPILVTDGEVTLYANRKAAELFRYEDPSDLIGVHIRHYFPEQNREQILERALGRIGGELLPTLYDSVIQRKDGSTLVVEFNISMIEYNGKPAILNIMRDLSERIQEQEILTAIGELVNPMLNPDSTIYDITIQVLNHALSLTSSQHGFVSEVDEVTKDSLVHTFTSMMQDCKVSLFKTRFAVNEDGTYRGLWGHTLNTLRSFYTNEPDEYENRIGVPDGHIALINFLSVPVIIGNELVGQISVANSERDYGDEDVRSVERLAVIYALAIHRMRAEQERDDLSIKVTREQMRAEQAEEMEQIKTSFMNTATHEIRTPITSIKGYTELIHDAFETRDYETAESYFEIISRNVQRLEILSNDLLDVQRLESGRVELDIKSCELDGLIKEIRS